MEKDLNRQPKVLRITTAPISIISWLKGQIKFMSTHGFDIKMVSNGEEFVEKAISQENVNHITIPMSRKFRPLQDLVSVIRFYNLFRNQKPHIIHTNSAKAGLLSMIGGKLSNIPIRIYSVGGLKYHSKNYSKFKRKFMILIEKLIYLFATDVWVNNPSLMAEINQLNLAPPEKVSMLGYGSTNGVDFEKFDASKISDIELAAVKHEIEYNEELIYFLFVGRLCGDKGTNDLVEVFLDLYNQNKKLRLLLVGPEENYDDPLDPKTLQNILEIKSIRHVRWSDSVEIYMHLATYLLFPSYREGLPNVIMQAGAMKLPVICSNIIGNNDLVVDLESGILFEPSNKVDMKIKIDFALKNLDLMRELSDTLYNQIKERYESKKVHLLIANAYNKLIEDRIILKQ